MKKGVAAAAGVIALAGLAAASVPLLERHAARQIKANIERDSAIRVDHVEVGLLGRSLTLDNPRTVNPATVSAGRWVTSGLSWSILDLLRGRVSLSTWDVGDPVHANRVEISNLAVQDPAGNAWKVRSAVIEGLDLERYDAQVPESPYRHVVLSTRALAALSARRVRLSDVSVAQQGGGDQVTIANMTLDNLVHGKIDSLALAGFGGQALARYGISLGGVTMTMTEDGADSGPEVSSEISHMRIRVDDFVLAPPLRGLEALQIRMALTAMGLSELRLGFDCAGTEDRGKGELAIDRCALTGPDLGEIEFTARLAGANEAFWQALHGGDIAELYRSKVALASAKLVVADKSLLERWLRAMAAASGQPVATARATLAQEVRQFQPADILITEDLTRLLDTVARFIERGGTLTVELKPDPPFVMDKLGSLATPGPDLIDVLGVTATLAAP